VGLLVPLGGALGLRLELADPALRLLELLLGALSEGGVREEPSGEDRREGQGDMELPPTYGQSASSESRLGVLAGAGHKFAETLSKPSGAFNHRPNGPNRG
jgi:hypothetical protein